MQNWLTKVFPILQWLPKYGWDAAKRDLSAGLTTGVMLIPQGMAYAVIAGVPPIYGLYAGLVPLVIYPLMGTSRHISIGPVAIDMLIVAAAFGLIADLKPSEYVPVAMVIAFLTGITQIMLGTFRLGFVFNFFSRPVISGFTIAAPIIIAFSQAGNLLGLDLVNTQFVYRIITDLVTHIGDVDINTLIVGACSITFLIIGRYISSGFPGALILVFIGIGASYLLDFEELGIALVGDIPTGLPEFALPMPESDRLRELFPSILTLALVQFMSVASLGKAFAKRHDYLIDANQELIAIGSSNMIGSFFHALPVSSSFSRSAAAEQSNVASAMANYVTAAVVLLTLLFLTEVFYYLPMSVLAAIIIVSAFGLIDIEELMFLFRTKRSEGIVAIFTGIATLVIGIQEGIILGVLGSMVVVLYIMSRPNVAELGLIPDTRTFKNLKRNPEAERIDETLILRIDAPFSFVNAEYFQEYILEKSEERNQEIRFVIIDGSTINDLDVTAVDSLKTVISKLSDWDIELYISGLKGHVRDVVRRSGLKEYLGGHHFFRTPHQAVRYVLNKLDKDDKSDRYLGEPEEEDRGERLREYDEKSG